MPDVMIPGPPQDPTVVSEPMVVDSALCVESFPDKVFRRRVPLRPSNGGTSG
ncbi:hypothetical protein L195_g032357 [Trifolium pratense]|uniref:Uncharacterized protein n=1 Tax=Trifolium pratense TaxID=57577 RepID=A0A2K3LD01_TRIPR|nr:hypothetical protein L195_g032357 [Trifolium pratense]